VDDGVARRLRDLGDSRDELVGAIEALLQTPQGALAARVQAFADHKRQLDDNLSNLETQFSRLATLRKDADGLSARFSRSLDLISTADAGADADGRIEELSDFVKATQSRFDEIEHTMIAVGQLKTKLGDLQSRLVPLESKDGGVADLLAQVQDIRDRLAAKVNGLEADENGDLATRVRDFFATKQDLEKRVAAVTEHFSKLATLRHDISGLFDKLSSAADAN
jgi:vacuolar-type H+-ATPase subunit I/STV1